MFCTTCQRELSEDHFFKNKQTGGYYGTCKECRKKYLKRYTKPKYTYFEPCTIPNVKKIVKNACSLFNITLKDFYSDCRIKEFALARKFVCQMLRDKTDMSTVQIGRAVHLDHTTVMYSCRLKSRLAVAEYLKSESAPLVPIKRLNYQTGEITIDYIPEVRQSWIKLN